MKEYMSNELTDEDYYYGQIFYEAQHRSLGFPVPFNPWDSLMPGRRTDISYGVKVARAAKYVAPEDAIHKEIEKIYWRDETEIKEALRHIAKRMYELGARVK